jgi:hypothetical protein
MADYRSFFSRDYIADFDLAGKDATVTIARIEAKELTNVRGTTLKPVIWFEGKERAFVANKTNAKTISMMYGKDTSAWIGKKITLYPTTTSAGGETVGCIRVRPMVPTEKGDK